MTTPRKRRHCILCGRKETGFKPLNAHPEGLGPACPDALECAKRRKATPPLLEKSADDLDSYRDTFAYLKARVQQLQRIPLAGTVQAERDEEEALITALEAMKDLSGSFHPDDMIQGEIPTRRW